VAIPSSLKKTLVLSLYNITGKNICSWNISGPGYHNVMWKGKSEGDSNISTGMYFARLYGGSKILQTKIILVK
ncbi:MAG: T9SS type A sorting domain-containing protein, partial [Fibrobacteres bacterium]|nr:T9SS type A sorting domain-containing protein [Fibrobacterota bacterium]